MSIVAIVVGLAMMLAGFHRANLEILGLGFCILIVGGFILASG